MPENILIVEYEPRYTDRVKQALAGQPFVPSFAKDGEEAIRALDGDVRPKLIVLSSVVPKISTGELIRAIRGRTPLQQTPILLTVSGYQGKTPRQDAQRLGASDILPKPYSESEFLVKVQQMLGVDGDRAAAAEQLSSADIFGDVLEERDRGAAGAKKTTMKQSDDLDKMLADTLSGVLPKKKAAVPAPAPAAPTPQPAPPAPPPAAPKVEAKPKTAPGMSGYDKLLEDTLSGLEKSVRPKTHSQTVATPSPTPAAKAPEPVRPQPPASNFATEKIAAVSADRIHAAEPLLKAVESSKEEEEEPADGTRFGQYVLLEKIATGGMAEVWKARMRGVEGFQKIVAIKKILPHLSDNQDFIEMFIDEAKLAAQLNHNNIIHIYDLGKIQNSYYIAMEYVDGWDLKTILRQAQERDQPISVELALFIATKIASALDYAHRKRDFEDREMGLVHRDVSPQNVLISEEGDIKLCDFGIAKAASKASHTQAGALKGKLQYMSPEQAWGKSIDRRSDVFALAAVLFEMLTARKLFAGDNEMSILEQVREARVVPPSQFNDEVTPEIDAVVLKALQKEPAQRYQTAGEMARDLDQILYTFKPTPTSADLAIYMHRLTAPGPAPHVEPDTVIEEKPAYVPPAAPAPVAASTPAAAAAVAAPPPVPAPAPPMPTWEAPSSFAPAGAEEPKKKLPLVPIAIAAALVVAIGIGAMLMRGNGESAPSAAAPSQATSNTPPPIAPAPQTTATLAATTATAPPTSTTATTATQTAIDPARVAEEVERRLAAERARLEQQARAQQQQPAAETSPRPAPAAQAPPAVQQATQTVPPPAPAETRPTAPQPQAPAAPAPTETRAAAAESPAESARVREGDLVSAGDDGVNVARMTRQASVPYPPVARMQRVQGDVLLNVLVSESGQVLDVRIVRGINRPVGLNEAATQTIRRSSFAPGTKNGVRVKMWIPVELRFRL